MELTRSAPGRVAVCAPVMPEFDRESGSSRLYAFIRFLRDAGWDVTFVSRYAIGPPDRYVRLLADIGVVARPAQGDDISELLRHERFDLALLAFWEIGELYMPALRERYPRTKIIVDSVDLHVVRNARQMLMAPTNGGAPGLLDASLGADFVRELNVYAAADAVLTVSSKEANLVNALLGDQANAHVVPDFEELPRSPRPFGARRGLLFVGNFRHAPNLDGLRYLANDILPRLPEAVLEVHPVYVIGNAVDDEVRNAVAGLPHVRLVGWVPSLTPYLDHARVAIVPLRYGAGTKRKLVQSLMTGLPSVSTTVGAEGLDLQDGEHVLLADDPDRFAAAVVRLVKDQTLWRRLASNGRAHVTARQGREVAHRAFFETIASVQAANGKRPRLRNAQGGEGKRNAEYPALVERVRAAIDSTLPPEASVLVISKGDEALLELGQRRGWHFPQTPSGVYAGHHPGDSTEAIAHLEALRAKGAEYLVVPSTSRWWLDYYSDFARHLEQNYRLVCDRTDACLIFALGSDGTRDSGESSARESVAAGAAEPNHAAGDTDEPVDVESLRPQALPLSPAFLKNGARAPVRVLAIGIYLANRRNTVEDVVHCLSRSRPHRVDQHWIALGGPPPSSAVGAVTKGRVEAPTPKYRLINEVLAHADLSRYDYVLTIDDDVVLPRMFVARFVALQRHFAFALAQPARTSRSFIDHPIVEQQRGSIARQTRFVEIGPVVSFHRSVFDLVFPFDLTSPMGWGYENVWAARLTRRKLAMGIIDAVPVDHSVRPTVAHYQWADADRGRTALLGKEHAPPLEDCLRVLRIFTAGDLAHARPKHAALD
jgi:glycosyltransferase involved in cell wall biosynthesis